MTTRRRGALWSGALLALLVTTSEDARADQVYLVSGTPGRAICGQAGTGWQQPDFEERGWSSGGADGGSGGCAGTLYTRWHFPGGDVAQIASLALRLRYQHGFAAYLNGVEIVRRRLDPQASAQAFASEPHGLLPETITLPVAAGALRDGDNVLAVEVHTTRLGKEPFLDVELVGRQGARLLRGPYLQNLDDGGVDVIVDTDLQTTAALRLLDGSGAAEPAAKTLESPLGRRHVFAVRGLRPATRYAYEVAFTDERGNRVELNRTSFHTVPSAGKPVRFVVYGDVRSGHETHAQLNRAILDEDPDFVLMTGDLVAAGSDDGDWERYFAIAQPLIGSHAVYPAPGNHEYYRMGRGRQKFYDFFRTAATSRAEQTGWASFSLGGLRFLALDSNEYKSAAHLQWVAGELERAAKRREPIFVYSHEGPFATGMHGDNATAIQQYVPLYERFGVALVMYGHDHHYERGRVGKTNYVLSGGGGAELRMAHCGAGRKCGGRVLGYANEHHYVLVEVVGRTFRVCPKRADGSAIEACASYSLPRPDRK